MKYRFSAYLLLTIVLALALSYVCLPNGEDNENRTLATFDMVLHPQKDSVVYRDSPVERLDAALSDQIPYRHRLTGSYLRVMNGAENLSAAVLRAFSGSEDPLQLNAVRTVGNYLIINDEGYITAFPSAEPYDQDLLQRHAAQMEQLHETFKDLKMYVYFITQAFDTNWFESVIGTEVPDHYEEIRQILPDFVKSSRLTYTDPEEYKYLHYRTDHHWNHRGAQKGYEDVYDMMRSDFSMSEPLKPVVEVPVTRMYGVLYKGSYGRALGDLYEYEDEEFFFYDYDFPPRICSVIDPETMEEIPVERIGLYQEYRSGDISRKIEAEHYGLLYGSAVDTDGNKYRDRYYPYVIRNSEGNGKSLLICGDSYGRAVRDLLSAHFSTTVYIDYRLLDLIPIDRLLKEYEADALLIISNASMWNAEEYFFTFSGKD